MTQSPWWAFDGLDDEDIQDAQLSAHEKAALEAVRAIADLGEAHPEKGLIVGAALRKISTIAGSRAQSMGLRSVTIRKGGQ